MVAELPTLTLFLFGLDGHAGPIQSLEPQSGEKALLIHGQAPNTKEKPDKEGGRE